MPMRVRDHLPGVYRGSYLANDYMGVGYSGGSSGRKLVAIIGQSNAVGRKFIEQVSQPQHDILINPYPNVRIRQWESTNDDPPQLLYDSATGGGSRSPVMPDEPLQPRPYSLPTDNMGVELSLGHGLDAIQRGFDIVKFGIGATSLAVHWNPAGGYPSTGPSLFSQMIAYLKAAEVAFGAKLSCVVWIQGETDALNASQALAYGTNLANFIAALRTFYPGIAFVFDQLSINYTGGGIANPTDVANVRAGQATVAGTVSNTYMVSWDSYVLDQGTHLVPDAYVAAGYQFVVPVANGCGLTLAPTTDFRFQAKNRTSNFTDLSTSNNFGGSIVAWQWDFGDGGTSTSQNPSHTYSADGSYVVALTATDSRGASTRIARTITIALPTWTTDATAGTGFPANASEWTDIRTKHSLVLGNPKNLYLMQEASGSLIDQIGGKNLAFTNSPSYHKTQAGFSRFFVGASGAATTQSGSNTTMANINTTSVMVLAVLLFNTTATNRQQVAAGASGVNELEVGGGTNKMRKRTGATGTNSQLDHAGVVRPFVLRYAVTPQLDELFSDIEKISQAYVAQSGTSLIATFSLSSDTAATSDMCYLARWEGADAEIDQSEIKHLLQALGYGPSGY